MEFQSSLNFIRHKPLTEPILFNMKRIIITAFALLLAPVSNYVSCQDLKLNDLEYFETQGVNVLVYSNLFTGGSMMRKTPE